MNPYPGVIPVAIGREKVAQGALLVDVRTPEEFAHGHIAGAINIPYDEVFERISEFGTDKTRQIVLYCAVNPRAMHAQRTLSAGGFVNAFAAGGYFEWKRFGD